jgi:cytochrome P450
MNTGFGLYSFLLEKWMKGDETDMFQNDKREALQPFSYGSRACIGRKFISNFTLA